MSASVSPASRLLERSLLHAFQRLDASFDRFFGPAWNPWHQLGALSFLFFWILVASGVYLFVFFDTSLTGAYLSVQYLTESQPYLGGIARSVHRYASDALVVTVTLHLVREFAHGRFRGAQAFSFISGVPLLWLLFAAGIGGYWLVWDQLAQYIAVVTTEWLERLPVVSDALARAFLTAASVSDRLFSLMVFLHIAIPLFLLVGMFIHVKRLKLPRTQAARGLVVGTLIALVVLSVARPAQSMPPADLSVTVALVNVDWFYMNVYPLLDHLDGELVWMLLVGFSTLLVLLPWLSPRKSAVMPPAVVDPVNCNGCSWCVKDCPYEAVSMVEHSFKKGHRQAVVDADLCTSCGICVGACPSATPFRNIGELVSGIEMPAFRLDQLRALSMAAVARLKGNARVLVFGCDHALDVGRFEGPDTGVVSLPCTGMLPPSFVDYLARLDTVDAVVVSGCHQESCHFRKGSQWIAQRLAGQRMPHLRTEAGHGKVVVCTAGLWQTDFLTTSLDALRRRIRAARTAARAQDAIP